jgi:hypothetical protein
MFHIVETLANSPLWLGLCGFGVIVMPIIGIQYIHEKEKNKGG